MYSADVQQQLSTLQQHLDTLSQGQSKLGLEVAALKADAPHMPAVSAEVRTGSQAEQPAADSSPAQSADTTFAAGTVPSSSPGGKDGHNLPVQASLAAGMQADKDLVQRVDALASEVGKSHLCYSKLPVRQLPVSKSCSAGACAGKLAPSQALGFVQLQMHNLTFLYFSFGTP